MQWFHGITFDGQPWELTYQASSNGAFIVRGHIGRELELEGLSEAQATELRRLLPAYTANDVQRYLQDLRSTRKCLL